MRKILIATLLMTGAARAETPRVLTDIAPVHSLVAQVMGDLGTPELLLEPNVDPHHFQMRPSQARQVSDADVMIWMGEAMTPWLPDVLGTVGDKLTMLELLELDAMPMLVRGDEAELHGPDEHVQDQDTDVAEDHEDHEEGEDHEDHGTQDSRDDHAGHSHGDTDPHAWLDPENARAFLSAIAKTLATADPDNADTYRANADAARADIAAFSAEITAQLDTARHAILLPYHDAYRYFFIRYDLQVHGAIADSEATPPSAGRLAKLRDMLAQTSRFCVFSEPGGNLNLIRSVLPDNRPIHTLDPLGSTLAPGPEFYKTLMRNLATAIATCEAT